MPLPFVAENPATIVRLGFKLGKGGVHAARTMMLTELRRLLPAIPKDACRSHYRQAIVDENLLEKPTVNTRKLTFHHLCGLYALDPEICLFRIFRELWPRDGAAQPVLALQMALTRDALLRRSAALVVGTPQGQRFEREVLERLLSDQADERFSAASVKSFARNINGTWTQAGFLAGHAKKIRSQPVITPVNVSFSLFLGHLQGRVARRLFCSDWARVLDLPEERLIELTHAAAQQGLLVFRRTGEVMEVRFPDYLTQQEQDWLSEQA